jgi:DDE family transposase
MLLVRLLAVRRRPWPRPHILVRGASHGATPEGVEGLAPRRGIDWVFGWAGHAVWLRQAAPIRQAARGLYQQRTAHAQAQGARAPARRRGYEKCSEAAASGAQPWRVIIKAEGRAAGDPPRVVVTSLEAPTPQRVYAELSCARGNCANESKAVHGELHGDRPTATTCLANAMRLLRSCAASVLPHALRTHTLAHTPLATAQPSTLILTRCKVATQVKQYKERLLLHLPTSCPIKALLARVTALLSAVPVRALHTS